MKPLRIITLLMLSLAVIMGVQCLIAEPAAAHNWLGDCVVDFDNTFALTYIYGQARGNFGYPTGIDSTG
ncbi:MAG: hypothetical protein KF793_13510, partial [Nitrospira sp.]|nr:hypothetical protein [Nitrospira sp.]